jgi:hypothetical protein
MSEGLKPRQRRREVEAVTGCFWGDGTVVHLDCGVVARNLHM